MKSVLLVDDQSAIRNLVRDALETWPETLDVIEACDGDEAVDKLQGARFDVMILDIRMPGKDGYEVLEWVRGNRPTAELPVIMLTAENEEPDIVKGAELGATSYVTKPFNLDDLYEALKGYL